LPGPIWLNVLGTKHDYVLYITQTDVEKAFRDLCENIGVKFNWGWKFVSLEQNGNRALVTVEQQSGEETDRIQQQQTIDASWVVGCDGTRSAVREQPELLLMEHRPTSQLGWRMCTWSARLPCCRIMDSVLMGLVRCFLCPGELIIEQRASNSPPRITLLLKSHL
jgi:hypothetical protein